LAYAEIRLKAFWNTAKYDSKNMQFFGWDSNPMFPYYTLACADVLGYVTWNQYSAHTFL
jgi:hypothetical protein